MYATGVVAAFRKLPARHEELECVVFPFGLYSAICL